MSHTALAQMLIIIQILMILSLDPCSGDVILTVSPYPARIYKDAGPNVPVLTVRGYDNFTGVQVTSFVLENKSDAKFFKIDAKGVIRTRQKISFDVGRTFQFLVAGLIYNQQDVRHVIIKVSEKNEHAPRFSLPRYNYVAYRYGVGDALGLINVTDDDVQDYNREVTVFIDSDQVASRYIEVGKDNKLRLIQPVPDHITSMNFTVLAVDGGSPQFTSAVEVQMDIVMVRQPSIFCLSITQNAVTLCWKNPMPQVDFDGYDVTVSGGVNKSTFLPALSGHQETCNTENDTGFGKVYDFQVIITTTERSFGTGLFVSFTKTHKLGHSIQCEADGFSVCSYKNLCNGHGECITTIPGNYTCLCQSDWRGSNCDSQDICAHAPCINNGDCQYLGHQKYKCHCPSGYYGYNCEYINQCLRIPCQNSGTCVPLSNGTYRCDCPPQFAGDKCQKADPCTPMPCVADRGECVPLSDTDYKCECIKGYHGQRCELRNACILESTPCNYQGTCIPVGDSFYCLCPPGTTGQTCTYLDACYIKPCINNATCTNGRVPGTYLCLCLPGYYGNECQKRNHCQDVNCNNGICELDSIQKTRCRCFNGFYGDQCDRFDVCLTSPCNNHGTCNSSGSTSDSKTNFTCSCNVGWSGPDCSISNICALNVCKNGATCEEASATDFHCTCREGFYMEDCSAFNPCSRHECQNGAACQNVSQDNFICQCQKDWLGDLCEYESPCAPSRNPCQNGGECHILELKTMTTQPANSTFKTTSTELYSPKCECTVGYLGNNCEVKDPCLSSPCVHGDCHIHGESLSEEDLYVCSCNQNFTGRQCELPIDLCDSITCLNGGDCTHGLCVCPPGFTGQLCEQELPICEETSNSNEPCVVDEAMKSLQGLLDGTSDPSKLSAIQVMNFTNQLVNLYNHTLRDPKYAWTAFCVLGNLGKVNVSVSEEVEKMDNVNYRLREFLDNYTSEIPLGNSTGQINISSPDLQVKVISVQKLMESGNESITFQPYVTSTNKSVELNLEIIIPPGILLDTPNQTMDTRIQFIGYKRSQLFVPTDGFFVDDTPLHSHPVIAATVKGREMRNLTPPVEIRLFNITFGRTYTCVFWDPEGSKWSTEGVYMHSTDLDSVTCVSSHLTSFAVLLDVNSEQSISQQHEQILTYLTYIGCAISTSCLVITIITYALFKCLNNEKSGKILLQLCSALLLLNVSFLVGTVDVSGYSNEGCQAAGMLLHYFLLASLMWMLVEAVEMYQALVTVFSKYERLYLVKRCLLAWGIPVIIVAITAGVDGQSYYGQKDERQFCFLTSKSTVAYYTSLVAPSCAILVVNIFVFIMVARVILKPNFQQQLTKNSTSITPAQIRGAFTVMFLLGITWVFGPLAINEAQTVFSYLFCICNSLQGFLIFVFRCLFNPEAKLAWMQLFYTGTLKRKRGPIISSSSDSNSKGGDHRRHSNSNTSGYIGSSTRTTLSKSGNGFHPHPHQLHTTNGWHPNLNGLKRDKSLKEGNIIFNPQEYQLFPDKDEVLSPEYSVTTKRESLTKDSVEAVNDEQTHL